MGKPEGSLTDSIVGQAYMVQVMYAAVCPLVLKSNVRLATDKWRRCMLEALMGERVLSCECCKLCKLCDHCGIMW